MILMILAGPAHQPRAVRELRGAHLWLPERHVQERLPQLGLRLFERHADHAIQGRIRQRLLPDRPEILIDIHAGGVFEIRRLHTASRGIMAEGPLAMARILSSPSYRLTWTGVTVSKRSLTAGDVLGRLRRRVPGHDPGVQQLLEMTVR
jgi:hypothetical protein